MTGHPIANEVILHLIIGGNGDIEQALEAWRKSHRDSGAGALLDELKPFELALMKLLARPHHPSVYSGEALTELQVATGEDARITPTKVQGALRKLARLDLIGPTGKTGDYEIEDRAVLIQIRAMQNEG
jgi:hypothetical protein